MTELCPDCSLPLGGDAGQCDANVGPIGTADCAVRTIALLRQKLAASELENKAWRALAEWARIGDRTVFINMRGKFVASGDDEVNGKTAPSAIDLATKLGLLDKAGG